MSGGIGAEEDGGKEFQLVVELQGDSEQGAVQLVRDRLHRGSGGQREVDVRAKHSNQDPRRSNIDRNDLRMMNYTSHNTFLMDFSC